MGRAGPGERGAEDLVARANPHDLERDGERGGPARNGHRVLATRRLGDRVLERGDARPLHEHARAEDVHNGGLL